VRRALLAFAAATALGAACGGDAEPETAIVDGADGVAVFAEHCASCHGADGMGIVGPQLAGRVELLFPDVGDQVDFVARGMGPMPAFGQVLTPAELEAVVRHTRLLEPPA
jgi:mono/diheme cytochrome c family protein